MTVLDPLYRSQRLEIDALRERCAELEALLERAVYAAPEEIARIRRQWPVGQNLAAILVAMWRANGRPLTVLQLDAVSPSTNHGRLKDPDYRELKSISVWIYHLRLVLRKDAILNRHGLGYWLSPEARSRVDAVLA